MARILRFPDECAARDLPAGVAGRLRPKYAFRTMTTRAEEQRRFENRFLVGDWLVEPRLNRISRDGDRVQLELRAMDVLLCLAHRAGEPVEKAEILDEVWQTEFVADNTLTRRIAQLREAFGDDARNPQYIETIPKRGYRLIAEVIDSHDSVVAINPGLLEVAGHDSPYPGLAAYKEADAEVFFGRESEIVRLWRRISGHRLLAVIGPSGVGKSSLIRAGVMAHAPEGWRTVICQPGEEPFLGLARSLAPDLAGDPEETRQLLAFHNPDAALGVVSRWRARFDESLVVVDQFEELFTQNPAAVRDEFVGLLRRLVDGAGIHLVLVMRDDFLLKCHRHPELAPIFRDLTPVGPPPPAGLQRALVEPAAGRLFVFEDELLVEGMISEVESERGALPLLAFAVARLWDLRNEERRMLTREAYEAIGGVGGALAQHAEATVEAIGWERLPIVRELFRNLVTSAGTRAQREWDELLSVFEGGGGQGVEPSPATHTGTRVESGLGESTPRPVAGAGLTPVRAAASEVLSDLIDARLLTSFEVEDGETGPSRRVEIVHESLLASWPRLVRWRTQDADAAQLRDQLRQAARIWKDRGRPADLLWVGTAYHELHLWRERYPGGLSATEQAFVEAADRQAGKRRRRRRTITGAVVVAALVAAGVMTVLWQRSEHHARAVEARHFSEIARRVAERGSSVTALAYSVASLELLDDPGARQAALRAVCRSPMPMVVDTFGEVSMRAVFSPDGARLAASNARGEIVLFSSTGAKERSWQAHVHPAAVHFTPDPGVLFSSALAEPKAVFWSSEDGRRLGELDAIEEFARVTDVIPVDIQSIVRLIRFVRDPSAAAGWIVDQRPFELRRRFQQGHPPRAGLGPDGRWLILARGPELFLVDVDAPDEPPISIGRCESDVRHIAFSPRQGRFATVDGGGVVRVWALSGTASTVVRSWNGPANVDCHHLGFDGAGDLLVASYDHGEAQIFGLEDPPGADPLRIVDGTGGRAIQSAFHPGNRCLVTVSLGRIAVWPLVRSRYPYVLRGHEGYVGAVEFGPGGEFLVSSASDGTVRYWPLKTGLGAEPRVLHDWGSPVETLTDWMDLSEDGNVVVATGDRDFVRVIPLDGRPSRDLPRADQRLGRAAVSADGRRVATLGRFDDRNEVRIWDLGSDTVESLVLDDDTGWLRLWSSLEFSRDGQLYWSLDHQVWKWNPKTGVSGVVLPEGPRHFRISGDGRRLIGHSAIGGAGFELTGVFDLEDGSSIRLPGHGEVRGFALDSTGSVAVTGDLSGCIRIGSATGGRPHLLTADDSLVTAVDISPDGRWIASGHSDGAIRLWRTPDLDKPPLEDLPRDELLARLKSLTNLRATTDPGRPGHFRVRAIEPFAGWETVPEW